MAFSFPLGHWDRLKVTDHQSTAPESSPANNNDSLQSSTAKSDGAPADPNVPKEKKKPYINPERVKTGGNQRNKMSEEALAERMSRMREQNEKIKQRRMDVEADAEAFRQTQEMERAKLAQNKRVQEDVNRVRDQNAKRKLDKAQSREWDLGKPPPEFKHQAKLNSPTESTPENEQTTASSSNGATWGRGGPLRGARGRGRRGRGTATERSSDANSTTDVRDSVVTPIDVDTDKQERGEQS